MPARNELHFYPGIHVMIWVVDGNPSVWVQAWGGERPIPGQHYDVMMPRRTTPGRYLIYGRAPYVTRRWECSRLAWGTPLRVQRVRDHDVVVYDIGMVHPRWRPVRHLMPHMTTSEIKKSYAELYGDTHLYDDDADGIPDRWVFNDFGPWAVRYYRDANHDGRLDGRENLSGEMIHTTPEDEADNATGVRVELTSSHGCIHVSPRGRDKLLAAGALDPGAGLVIHRYSETLPAGWWR